MNAIFADTSHFLALVNAKDPRHKLAVDLAENCLGRIVTTDYVVVELGSALSREADRMVFLELLRHMREDPATTIVRAEPALLEQGIALFADRRDKEWSLVDCISFAVMKQRRLKEALTTDHHFEQAGFRALLSKGRR